MANTLNAVAIGSYVDGNGEVKKVYTNIGKAFETKNGWLIRLNALPVPNINDKGAMETVLMLMPPRDDNQSTGQRSQKRSSDSFDDERIPF